MSKTSCSERIPTGTLQRTPLRIKLTQVTVTCNAIKTQTNKEDLNGWMGKSQAGCAAARSVRAAVVAGRAGRASRSAGVGVVARAAGSALERVGLGIGSGGAGHTLAVRRQGLHAQPSESLPTVPVRSGGRLSHPCGDP